MHIQTSKEKKYSFKKIFLAFQKYFAHPILFDNVPSGYLDFSGGNKELVLDLLSIQYTPT